ncbi:PIG-L deacetylase family protein [Streptomyces marincola]|uniref:N-acetylglucosaminyl deacetylase, LmbE family n=1 Tax=Streptomyces marincola TaxID=2878388 RepID=A0A1W7D123_9ACTN|nr:PIG-L family deacetylase [Streptomyces marincola]ARQ70758.1 hypothetical protein CAG99_19640 [Streptomyces marincola]
MTTVLAIVAHPDDEVIGPGGTLAGHARAGDDVHVLILAEGKSSREAVAATGDDDTGDGSGGAEADASRAETAAAAAALGLAGWRRLDLRDNRLDTYPLLYLAQRVGDVVEEVDPDVVYAHHPGDLNVDHELAARAALIACRPHVSGVRWVLAFPTLSATDAGYAGRPPFVPAVYSDIGETLEAKLDAMRCYGSELRPFPHPRSLAAMRAQAELSGAHAGVAAAEGFSVLRGTWPPGAPGGGPTW